MKFKSDIPIYLQVCNKIKKDIVNKVLSSGDKLPSTREISLKLTINPNTAARVYKELESEGLTFTQRGKGTFVTEDKEKLDEVRREMAKKAVDDFLQEMQEMNISNSEIFEILEEELKNK